MAEGEPIRVNYEEITVGEKLGPATVEVTQEVVDEYLRVITDPNSWYREGSPFGGPVVPATFTANDYVKLARTKYSTLDTVHTYANHEYRTPVKVGDTLTIEGEIVDKYIRRGRAYIVWETVTTNQRGEVVVKSRNVWLVNASKRWPEDTGS